MRNKRKGIMMAAAILGSAAIISTGFAAWVVTVNDEQTATGNIVVDEVTDHTHLIEKLVDGADYDVYFGKAEKTAAYSWLTNDAIEMEDLEAKFTVKVSNHTSANLDVKLTMPAEYSTKIDGKSLFKAPTLDVSEFTSEGVVTITITFAWGEYFNNVNPINYYNSFQNPNADIRTGVSYAKDAIDTLRKVYELNSKQYTVTLTTTDGAGTVTKSVA